MIALFILVAVVALIIAGALRFDTHCENRFGIAIFEIGRVLVNVAGWSLLAAGAFAGTNGILLMGFGTVILLIQLIRLIVKTTLLHGILAFIFLSFLTVGILVVIVLVISAVCDNRHRRVIVLD